eukprot:328156-Pyramimonas_sp.AAC.1
MLKRGLASLGKGATMQDIVNEVKACVPVWRSEPLDEDRNDNIKAVSSGPGEGVRGRREDGRGNSLNHLRPEG